MNKNYFVIADYDRDGVEETEITFRIDRVWLGIKNLIKYYFTKKIEISKPHYTNIYTITENGAERLEEMPKHVITLISRKEDAK